MYKFTTNDFFEYKENNVKYIFYINIYFEIVKENIIKYSNLNSLEIENICDKSYFFNRKIDNSQIIESITYESPYYWAMTLVYGHDSYWWNTIPNTWPPPSESYEITTRILKKYGVQDYLEEIK